MLQSVGNDWSAAKRAFIGQPGQPMLKLTAFREAYVNALIDSVLRGHQGATRTSVGSQNETSDYDVTLVGGDQTWSALNEFNKIFRGTWGKESGIVFDTNVYAGSIPPPTAQHSQGSWMLKGAPGCASRDWQKIQEVASLTKMRRYMHAQEWRNYVERVADGVMEETAVDQRTPVHRFTQATYARDAFSAASGMYDSYIRSLAPVLEAQWGPRRPAQSDDDFVWSVELGDESAVIRARNTLYAIHVRGAQDTERSFMRNGPSSRGHGDWRSQAHISAMHSKAHVYAMEAYYSAGAIFDVVYRQQAGLVNSADLTFSDFVQSFNEQVGDTLKDLHHYESDPGRALYQSAKYTHRMGVAADELLQRCGSMLPPEAAELMTSFRKWSARDGALLQLRAGGVGSVFAGLSDSDKSCIAIEHSRQILGVSTLPTFRRKLLQLAEAVHVLRYSQYRSGSTGTPGERTRFYEMPAELVTDEWGGDSETLRKWGRAADDRRSASPVSPRLQIAGQSCPQPRPGRCDDPRVKLDTSSNTRRLVARQAVLPSFAR
ncbi:hypothetical protein ACFY0Z_33565 [Streptomyces kronopolitis]|uniref:hypothetical protein n=1 Tax=Streptomyces kronopolitis TaxID=1612435 RepID=UPI0036BF86D4